MPIDSSSDALVKAWNLEKRAFLLSHRHLSEEQRLQRWSQEESHVLSRLVSTVSSSCQQGSHIPRSFSNAVPMSGSDMSRSAGFSMPAYPSNPAASAVDSASNHYAWKVQSCDTSCPLDYDSSDAGAIEYEPAAYIAGIPSDMNDIHPAPPQLRLTTERSVISRNSHPSTSSFSDRSSPCFSDFNTTPATPMTSATTAGSLMSRQASMNGGLSMLRLQSNLSSISQLPNSEDYPFDKSPHTLKSDALTDAARSHTVSHADFNVSFVPDTSFALSLLSPADGQTSSLEAFPNSSPSNASPINLSPSQTNSLASQASNQGILWRRSLHSASPLETLRTTSRSCSNLPSSTRHHAANRAANFCNDAEPVARMLRIDSIDGKPKAVAPIPRAPYRRPEKPKLVCPYCPEHPEGFRGDHELQRHIQRRHSTTRKYWIANDVSENKKFLASCKYCRSGKKYYAYYNLAAHLRRLHFNKKDKPNGRGRRRRGAPIPESEKKGGKSGGHTPSIDQLREEGWILELEETVPLDLEPSGLNSKAAASSPPLSTATAILQPPTQVEIIQPLHQSQGGEGVQFDVSFCPKLDGFDGSRAHNQSLSDGLSVSFAPSDDFAFFDPQNMPQTYDVESSFLDFSRQQQAVPTAVPFNSLSMQQF